MVERRLIIYLKHNRKEYRQITSPIDINEVEIEECLRDMGYYLFYRGSCIDTNIYEEYNTKIKFKEISIEEYRSLKNNLEIIEVIFLLYK